MKSALLFLVLLGPFGLAAQDAVPYGSNEKVGKYLEVNDIKVYYEIYGEGEPLLLIHGGMGSIETFTLQIPEFSKYFKVIAVDSRAQGRSTDSEKEITYALMASDMAELISKLKLGSVNMVGWSDGGNVGLELAYAHPEMLKKLVCIGGDYTHENYEADTTRTVWMAVDDPLLLKTRDKLIRYMGSMDRLSSQPDRVPEIRKKLGFMWANYPNFTPDQLQTIQTPTLVMAGDHDLIRDQLTFDLYEALPHAQLCIFPGATHLLLWEIPEFANQTILNFLKTPYRDIDRLYFFR